MAMPSSPPEVSASLPPSALKRGAAKGNQGRAVHFAVQGPGPGEIPTRQMAYVCSAQCSTRCSLPLSSVASPLSLFCSTQCSTRCSLPLSSVASPLSLFCSTQCSTQCSLPLSSVASPLSLFCSTQCSLPLSSVASPLSLFCSTQCSTQCSLPLSSVASPLSLFCSLRHSLHVLYSSFNTLSCPLNLLTWASESTTIITNITSFLLLNNDTLLSTGTCHPSVSLSLLAAHLCQRRCR
jgi:hypothetical protein